MISFLRSTARESGGCVFRAAPVAPGWLLAALCCTWMCGAVLAAGEPKRITVAPGLFELRLDGVPSGADVSWEAKQPLTLDYRQYERGAVFVSHSSGGELVVVSDVIDWDAKTRDKTTWIVTVGEKKPEPKPDPTVPPPTGLAGEIYAAAKPIGDAPKCLKYAENYEVVSTEIAAGAIKTPAEARARIVSLNEPLQASPRDPRWKAVGDVIASKLSAVTQVSDVKAVMDAAVVGLRAAGGAK